MVTRRPAVDIDIEKVSRRPRLHPDIEQYEDAAIETAARNTSEKTLQKLAHMALNIKPLPAELSAQEQKSKMTGDGITETAMNTNGFTNRSASGGRAKSPNISNKDIVTGQSMLKTPGENMDLGSPLLGHEGSSLAPMD